MARGAGHHPLLPCRGHLAGQLEGVDAGVVGLQVGPEQLAQQVGEVLQGGEVHRRLAFAQVVDEHVAHRAAGDPIAVDQLLAVRLPTAGEHLHRGRGVLAEHAVSAQQLVEQRAVRVRTGGGADAGGDLQQLDAVTDVHRGDRAALGGEDDRDAGQRLLPALQPDPAPGARLGERGERRGVAGAGHPGGQPAPRRGETQQPAQTGPDHIGADQHQQPRAQVRQLRARRCLRPPPSGGRGGDRVSPVGLVFGPAGLPALLPALTGMRRQPGQHGQHPQPAGLLAGRVVQRERRGQRPGQHRRPARPRRRPRRGDRPRRERGPQLRPGLPHRPARRRGDLGRPRGDSGRCGDGGDRLLPGGHGWSSPNRVCRLSARYPGAGGAAGSRSRARAWKASTPAITSSVTGFR